ncbi:TRAP transporter large permease subunit [Plastorhodobacter daqingensis]|uniref:TRAP transporter large permease subunit n=1 Tax=Plastorhodobacter daqingensis TaxID=1387281 RepID=A0ABW2UNE4_9RHOB
MTLMGRLAGSEQLRRATAAVTTVTLTPVPPFLIVGALLFHSGLAPGVFDAPDKCFGGIRRRLAYPTVGGGTIFATLSHRPSGTTPTPDMIKRGYKKYIIIIGPIIATGGLAMIIPPASLAVLLGWAGGHRGQIASERRAGAGAGTCSALYSRDLADDPPQSRGGAGPCA